MAVPIADALSIAHPDIVNVPETELEAIAAALVDSSDGLKESEIGHILATLKMADPAPAMTKWKRLQVLCQRRAI